MHDNPFTQSTEARLTALRHRMRGAERGIRAEQRQAVPDLVTLQRLSSERLRLDGEIVRYEGILRTLARTVSPVGTPDRRGA